MSNSLIHAFFVGRAAAEIISEKFELALTDALSELGKFDAEAREELRKFTEQVIERANREAEVANVSPPAPASATPNVTDDLQAMIDDLRAEIALLRAEIQRHRSNSI